MITPAQAMNPAGPCFEGPEVPDGVHCGGSGVLSLSNDCFKDGQQSLHWKYRAGDTLVLPLSARTMTERIWRDGGIRLWIYRRSPQTPGTAGGSRSSGKGATLRIDLVDAAGNAQAGFDYHLQPSGWRACWMAFRLMQRPQPTGASSAGGQPAGQQADTLPVACRLTAPAEEGELWLDRLVLPEPKADLRTTPDAQTPDNALVDPLQLGHWSSLWRWEQQESDLELRAPDVRARRAMSLIEERLDSAMRLPRATEADLARLERLWADWDIRESPGSGGFCGAPLVCADECRADAGEVSWRELDELMNLLARAATAGDAQAEQRYLRLWEYALDQGFAYGSCMGTNHHYGYATRNIFRSAWLMRRALAGHPRGRDILAALTYWSGLPETRCPLAADRADRCDGWNTLLLPRLMVALMEPAPAERERKLRGLARWVNASLEPTPGTLGGIKADGTIFHHGGFYPAYANDGLAAVGHYAELCAGTAYGLNARARGQLRLALETMHHCCNLRDWPLGICGRHPFRLSMTDQCVEAFARLAALEQGESARALRNACDHLRYRGGGKAGSKASAPGDAAASAKAARRAPAGESAAPPQGFFTYNHAAAGVYRCGEALVLMKGFNRDVWGSEIYTRDNRYGRYQSYGSVCILGGGRPVTQAASGFSEPGWDWNRVPGATTIHLPLDLLESPRTSTLMACNPQDFAGAGALGERTGLFAIHLQEADEPNFTPDFTARKSVFCCDGQLLCLGSGIGNSNRSYPTETTLFQCAQAACTHPATAPDGWLADGTGNFFRVLDGDLRQADGLQSSRENKTRRETRGHFRTAWLDHGKAPADARYAYLILIQPGAGELKRAASRNPFEILELSRTLHAARHKASGTWAYASFENAEPGQGPVRQLPAGLIVLAQQEGNSRLMLSVTDPCLHLPRHGRNVTEAGQPVTHELLLRGAWRLDPACRGSATLTRSGVDSRLKVNCRLGLPTPLTLHPL